MQIKKIYQYFFYKLYKHFEKGPSVWLSDWKAVFSIDVLIFFIILTGVNYYTDYTKNIIEFGNRKVLVIILGILILVPNYFIFHYKDRWKIIIHEFNKLPKQKNKIGGWVVFGTVLFIIANLIFSFYLMSQIDWNKYR